LLDFSQAQSIKMASTGTERPPSASASNASAAKDTKKSFWLDAWTDPLANLQAFSECMVLADLNGDGDYKLVVADQLKRLRVFKGTSLVHEKQLLDVPVAVASYCMDYQTPRRPIVAVASSNNVFLYRNLEPYYKFSLPPVALHLDEQAIWAEMPQSVDDPAKLTALAGRLEEIRSRNTNSLTRSNVHLSSRSHEFLVVHSRGDMEAVQKFVKEACAEPLVQHSVVTCMAVIHKDREDDSGVSCLVIGTEHAEVHVLDPAGSKLLQTFVLPSPPVFLDCTGVLDVDYRITAACRNGCVYSVKQGEVGAAPIELDAHPCGVIRSGKLLMVATVSQQLVAYHTKGKRAWTVALPSLVSCVDLIQFGHVKNTRAVVLALENRELRVYNEQALVACTTLPEAVTAMRFGRYGREDATLILLGKSGTLYVKILPRKAAIEGVRIDAGPPAEQETPLQLPKRTRLYMDQTQREREFGGDMHRIFQRDLCRLRLSTVQAYAKMVMEAEGPVSYSGGVNLRLAAKVQGLGPLFKVKLDVTNHGSEHVLDVPVSFAYRQTIYRVRNPLFTIPCLVPGTKYSKTIEVDCIDPQGTADVIRVFLCNPRAAMPYLTAAIHMPPSELPMFEN
jgi:Bardet-Biedl syndrome 1 protein